MNDSTHAHRETFEGFTIDVYRETEYDSPADYLAGEERDDADTLRAIERGALDWFAVRVTASKNGIELGSDYLGACIFDSIQDFIGYAHVGEYYADMRAAAVAEARAAIKSLCEA